MKTLARSKRPRPRILVIGPTALAIALGRGDLLAKRGLRIGGSAWQDADTAKPDLERAKLLS